MIGFRLNPFKDHYSKPCAVVRLLLQAHRRRHKQHFPPAVHEFTCTGYRMGSWWVRDHQQRLRVPPRQSRSRCQTRGCVCAHPPLSRPACWLRPSHRSGWSGCPVAEWSSEWSSRHPIDGHSMGFSTGSTSRAGCATAPQGLVGYSVAWIMTGCIRRV